MALAQAAKVTVTVILAIISQIYVDGLRRSLVVSEEKLTVDLAQDEKLL